MTTKTRVAMTFALGIVLGFYSWIGNAELSPSHETYEVFGSLPAKIAVGACFILVPLLVVRFWVVSALAGPLIVLTILGVAGKTVYEDGMASPLNEVTVFEMFYLGFFMVVLVGIRKGIDYLRLRRSEGGGRGRPPVWPDRRV
jgi:hypothetical protein